MNPVELTLAEAARQLRSRETTAVALAEACIARMEETEPALNAFITPTPDAAMEAAARADSELTAGRDRGPLHGIPIAIKDLCATKGVRTTAGSKVLADWVPDFDATVVTKLAEAGAVSLGKLNLHEFAYGTTSKNEHYGAVHNPWDTSRHPGGSSGGSGAAVAAGVVFAAIGSDTGGSIRIPAALCGTAGLMPTYGLVSRAGVTPLSWSLDHIGPLARTSEDCALFLEAIAGYDPADPASVRAPGGWSAGAGLDHGVGGLRIGIARSQFERVQPEVAAAVTRALEVLRGLGATITDVQLPLLDAGLRLPILAAEAASYHQRWLKESPELYSDQVRRSILLGQGVTAVEYLDALRVRREFTEEVRSVMASVDAIAMPTCPAVAEAIDTEHQYYMAVLTSPWDHTGQPVLAVPCGFGQGNLPIGISFAGRPFEEGLLCRIGHAYEQATGWWKQHPPL
jgi:aspartyl-tRNA(Asn)/glutamyl-tRNA(Gln) amidotransferase subunit A